MAPLAVAHHFLHVSPLCNNLFLHDFMGIEGEEKGVSYVKQVALAETCAGLCSPHSLPQPPPTTLTAPLPLPHSLVWSPLGPPAGVGFDHWQKVAVVRFLPPLLH